MNGEFGSIGAAVFSQACERQPPARPARWPELSHMEPPMADAPFPALRDAAPPDLVFASDDEPGIRRRRRGKGFMYVAPDGATVRDPATLQRIRKLAIPPAWTDVWISPSAETHLQATGRDAKGRKQYRYHPAFSLSREAAKFEHLLEFAEVLPVIRERTATDLRRHGLPREKVLAAVVRLLETTLIRVGNETYARENRSFGLTTLRARHVAVEGAAVRFEFKGKSGKNWKLKVSDRRLARIVRTCQELPGQKLFQYLDEDGTLQGVDSSDVNAYLREIAGRAITAKDFRTWAGTVLAALALHEIGPADTKKASRTALRRAIERVAARLGNTPSICRKSYVHPEVVAAFQAGELELIVEGMEEADEFHGLEPEEVAVIGFLRRRLAQLERSGVGAAAREVRAAAGAALAAAV
jgi:DNA topoisomerase-1